MNSSLEQHWMQRARFLTLFLILSGTLNIGFLSAFIYGTMKDKLAVRSYKAEPSLVEHSTNEQILKAYSRISFQDLMLRLENKEPVEEGYSKRDLALACLVGFHHLDIEKALGGILLQKRIVAFHNVEGNEKIEITAFTGLKDEHFEAVTQFVKREKWPLTSKGLFFELSRNPLSEASLVASFLCTAEFHSIYSLVQKNLPGIAPGVVLDLLKEGSWTQCLRFFNKLRALQCYTSETYRELLTAYALESHAKTAAFLLLEHEIEYVMKRFDDTHLISFLHLLPKEKVKDLALSLLVSQRSDALRECAASLLYAIEGVPVPQPYDYLGAVLHFYPEKTAIQSVAIQPDKSEKEIVVASIPAREKNLIYKVQAGDSLWKIARKHGVTVEAISKLNQLESDRLKLGRELKIPERKN